MSVNASIGEDEWRQLVAIGLIAGDLTVAGISRYSNTPRERALYALEAAAKAGLSSVEVESAALRTELVNELDADVRAEIHLKVARDLLAEGGGSVDLAIHHLRLAGSVGSWWEDAVSLAELSGRLSLTLGHYNDAVELLSLAQELDMSDDIAADGRRLCDLAQATDGLGDVVMARKHLAKAIVRGEQAQDSSLVARAAVMYTLPIDWYAGDPRTVGFLKRAESMEQTPSDQVRLTAARALAEIRVPVIHPEGHQLAWVTRPTVAQPLAERALSESAGMDSETRLLALLAWRTTHRAPLFLERRRHVSLEALDLAQQMNMPALHVEAAVWLAVDALESGDRPLYDRAVSVARWVASSDGNPRLLWRAATLNLCGLLLEENYVQAEIFREEMLGLGAFLESPDSESIALFFVGQQLVRQDDRDQMQPFLEVTDHPGLLNPIARIGMAFVCARCGEEALSRQMAWSVQRQIDSESSLLLCLTRSAAVAHVLRDRELAEKAIEQLAPWVKHVSVDGNGWWCDGPVAIWLAMLYEVLGEYSKIGELLEIGEPIARQLNDVQSLRRAEGLRERNAIGKGQLYDQNALTDRERAVLKMVCEGATNPQIAKELSYSLSTIRMDTMSIYRKLGVDGRVEAIGKALERGLWSTQPS